MDILILGGTGFLGRGLALAALNADHTVTCLARGSAPAPAGVEFIQADRDHPGLTPFLRSGDCVSRPVARGFGQGDWSDHDEQQEASHPGAGRP